MGSEQGGARHLRVQGPLSRAAEPWPLAPVLLILTVCWIAMVWPWLVGNVTIPWDAKAHFQPQIQFLAQSLARGEMPFWNPFVFSGHPQVADPQSMIFSPPYLVLALVAAVTDRSVNAWAIDMTTLGTAFAGGVALVVWFRDRGWHFAGALVAALAFIFGASMAWRMQHTGQVLSLAYWPIAMLAIDRAFDRRSFGYAICAGAIGAAILLGRDQVALLVLYLLSAYILCRWLGLVAWPAAFSKTWMVAGVGGLVAIGLAAVPLLLTAQLAAESNRPAIDFEGAGRGSLHPALLITTIIPHVFGAAGRMEDYWGPPSFAWDNTGLYIAQNMGQLYIGALPVLFFLIAFWRGFLWSREIAFFFAAWVIVTLYALGWYTPVFRLFYGLLPGVSLYRRPADATFVMGALGAVISGYAVHLFFVKAWEKLGETAVIFASVVVGLAFVSSLLLGLWLDRVQRLGSADTVAAVAFLVSLVAIYFALPRRALEPWVAAGVLAGVLALDLGWNNGPSTSSALPPETYEVLEPGSSNPAIEYLKSHVVQDGARRDRVELLGLGFHWPNASMTHQLENTLGYNPVRLGNYSRATGAEDHVGLPDQRKLSKLFPSYTSQLADLLGLRYVASGAPLQKVDPAVTAVDWPLVAQSAGVWIYENPRALPRVLFAERSQDADFEMILSNGTWPDFNPRRTVLLQASREPGNTSGNGPDKAPETSKTSAGDAASSGSGRGWNGVAFASISKYANNEVVIDAEGARGGYVVLNDLYHKGWVAEVDGQPVPMLRANVLFRAVAVPPGRHVVRFRFRPFRDMFAWFR